MFKQNRKKGFTLIELLVVISVISLLSSVILASLRSARDKARTAKAQMEIDQFIRMATIAQGAASKTMIGITGNGCSECACRGGRDIRNIPESDQCYINWINVLTTAQNATGGAVTGMDKMKRDPWGSPYTIDENEGEGGFSNCTMDYIGSAGPDGVLYTADDVSRRPIPLFRQPCP